MPKRLLRPSSAGELLLKRELPLGLPFWAVLVGNPSCPSLRPGLPPPLLCGSAQG